MLLIVATKGVACCLPEGQQTGTLTARAKSKFHQKQILNIFIYRQLTEYEYRIYSFLTT